MRPRKFVGANSREVLKQVREALGPDALILSNAKVAGGIEVVALPGGAINDLMAGVQRAPTSEPPAQPRAPIFQPATPAAAAAAAVAAAAAGTERRDPVMAPAATPLRVAREPVREPAREPVFAAAVAASMQQPAPAMTASGGSAQAAAAAAAPVPVADPEPGRRETAPAAAEALFGSMMAELRTMRSMLEHQLAGLAWGELARRDPAKVGAMRTLLGSGFGGETVRRLTEPMPPIAEEREATRWLAGEINRNLATAGSDNDIVERGGVYAIMGPTGVGKTTTTAKLAARCVVRHGADRVALLTTDTYRIGAHEQLRIYGRILGVTTCVVKDAADLRLTLADLRGKHMVLIDTVGMSQRDQMVAEQVATLSRSGGNVRRLLLLNATCNGETLEDVVRCYEPGTLDGCIITKLDEAGSVGAVLDVLIRHRLVLHFIANGQRVPEDLHVPNRQYLIHRALRPGAGESPLALSEEAYPLMLAAARGVARQLDDVRTAQAGGRLA